MSNVSGKDVAERNRACRLAPTDWRGALQHARNIESPWYRCQALAWAARYAPGSEVERLCHEAFASVENAKDAFQRVAPTAWPLRALIERGLNESARSRIATLVSAAMHIESVASRSEALFTLLQAVFPGGPALWKPLFLALQAVSEPIIHWRQARNLRDAILFVHAVDTSTASAALTRIQDRKCLGKLQREVASSGPRSPRPFFWEHVDKSDETSSD